MPLEALVVRVDWWPSARVPARVRRKLDALLQGIAPQLNEVEACLHDLQRHASHGLEWLIPKIELNLPLYEERAAFRLRLVRLDETRMLLETRAGDVVGEVFLR